MHDVHGLDEWQQTVAEHMPHMSKPQAVVLAMFSFGMVIARSCALTAVTDYLSELLKTKRDSQRQRLREFCYEADKKRGDQRVSVDAEACFVPLLRWVLSMWQGDRLALAIDATQLGTKFTVLAVSVLYRGCAIPVAWKVVSATEKGSWRPHWLRMLRNLRQAVPRKMTVIVLADRGLYAPWLYRRIVRLGWHPFLRINCQGYFRPKGAKAYGLIKELVPKVGGQWSGRGTAFKTKNSSVECTLLACWGERHEEPWFILTDLAPEKAEAGWYAMRAWIEHGFKIEKRGGWQWHRTRMADVERASRLWVVVAVATLWTVSVGGETDDDLTGKAIPELAEAVATAPRRRRATRVRLTSVFRRGCARIIAALLRHEPIPKGRLVPEPWPDTQISLGVATTATA